MDGFDTFRLWIGCCMSTTVFLSIFTGHANTPDDWLATLTIGSALWFAFWQESRS